MSAAFNELALALFTTLASIGAGTFVALAVSFHTMKFDKDALRKIDLLATAPLAVVGIAFICAFFHLRSPEHALGVFSNLGISPLSNELAVGVAFAVVAIAYWATMLFVRPSLSVRRAFCDVVAVLSITFAVFMGMAYSMPTIPTWDTAASPLQMVGFLLIGGGASGQVIISIAQQAAPVDKTNAIALAITSIGGALCSIGGIGATLSIAAASKNYLVDPSIAVSEITPWAFGSMVCIVLCTVLIIVAERKSAHRCALAGGALACAAIGIFAARLVFYALEISAGLSA